MPLEIFVLVASGDQDVADYLRRHLLALGCHACVVSRHSHVLAATESRAFHLALVAEELEGGSGLDVVAELRRRHPQMTLFLMATQANDGLFEQARQCGANRCVVRPTTGAAVEALLEDALEAGAVCLGTEATSCDQAILGRNSSVP